jgi:hypothetical protein
MSALPGTYKNSNIGATLVIADANDSNGEIKSATVNYDGQSFSGAGHYHFKNSGGPTTDIIINAFNDGIGYVTLALTAGDMQFHELKSFGGYVNFDAKATGLGGSFVK